MTLRSASILLRTLGVLLILYGGLIVAVPILLPYVIVRSPNFEADPDSFDDPTYVELRALGVDRHLRIHIDQPEVFLSCFVVEPIEAVKSRGTILVLHGHRDRKLSELHVGKALAVAGYRAILVDHRGHGLSTGDYVSYGVFESHDMMVLLDSLESSGLIAEHVGLLGFSYGGAVAIQLAAKDERVGAVVAISTFTSLRQVVGDYLDCFLPFATPFISEERIDEAVRKAGEIGGYDPADANTEAAVRTVHAPLLLFHGKDDRRIPIRHGERLSNAVQTECRFVRLPDCGHGNVMSGETGKRIVRESLEWFDRHLK